MNTAAMNTAAMNTAAMNTAAMNTANQPQAGRSQLTADSSQLGVRTPAPMSRATVCDVCGSPELRELRCKIICGNCRTILQSCADL
jgi:hypothetical protein